MIYNIVLVSIIIIYSFSKRLKKSQRRPLFLISCFLLLGLLSGFRYQNEYSDFKINYGRAIQAYYQDWNEVLHYSSEFVHQILRKLIMSVFRDPQWYFILTALFFVGAFAYCANKYVPDSCFEFIVLFFCIFDYFTANNITRQAVAVGVTIIAWNKLIEKKIVPFIILCAIAYLIHNSAIAFIPLYFLSYKKFTKNTLYAYAAFAIVVAIFNSQISSLIRSFIYQEYIDGKYGTTGSNPLRLLVCVICIFSMYIYVYKNDSLRREYITADEEDNINRLRFHNFLLHGTFIYVLLYVLSTLNMLMFARVAMYFSPCAIVCIVRSIEGIDNKYNRMLYRICILMFSIVWFLLMNYSGKLTPTPYTPFWLFAR